MSIEQHVLDEVGRQLDYYVDAYRKVHDIDLKLAELSERMASLSAERAEAEMLRDEAAGSVNALVADVPEDDEGDVVAIVNERLAPLVGLIVL